MPFNYAFDNSMIHSLLLRDLRWSSRSYLILLVLCYYWLDSRNNNVIRRTGMESLAFYKFEGKPYRAAAGLPATCGTAQWERFTFRRPSTTDRGTVLDGTNEVT